MEDITPLVRCHVQRLFRPNERGEVGRLLREDCGAALPGVQKSSTTLIERIQCAALKVSSGNIDELYDAVSLAQTDWRDLLISAGFANDPQAHENWVK
jgi:hypothetical protein